MNLPGPEVPRNYREVRAADSGSTLPRYGLNCVGLVLPVPLYSSDSAGCAPSDVGIDRRLVRNEKVRSSNLLSSTTLYEKSRPRSGLFVFLRLRLPHGNLLVARARAVLSVQFAVRSYESGVVVKSNVQRPRVRAVARVSGSNLGSLIRLVASERQSGYVPLPGARCNGVTR